MRRTARLAAPFVLFFAATVAHADEGMWPFNMIPKEQIAKSHPGVALTDSWLDHVRASSVRFNNGGSGSFVSSSGLVLTNHHVAGDCIQKLASDSHDYMLNGYIAGKDGNPEAKCPDLELNVLMSIQDVTDQVRAAKKDGMSDADANVAQKAAMTNIEKTCADKTGLRCDVVTLYAGGKYDLYSYKKYTDVRLVFAPEFPVAFFGGDGDNFTYPRFDLDMAIFRVYEGDKPLKPANFLRWNVSGPKDGETVFVSGHPGNTGRMQTTAQLTTTRDTIYPYVLDQLGRERTALLAFGKEGKEATRQSREHIFGLENGLKAITGFEGGLKDAALMKTKAKDEAALRSAIDADPKLKAAYGATFDDIAKAQKNAAAEWKRYAALERGSDSGVLTIARDLVRLTSEVNVPNDKRLREYRDSNLESVKLHLLSPAPLYGGVELALTREWLERLARDLGPNDPLVKQVLGGRSPSVVAREVLAGSKITDVNARKKLLDGGTAAIDASTDPAIVLMRTIDPEARAARKKYEDDVEAPMRQLGQKIAQAVFAVRGASVPPDATFTLRLSTGVVKGYVEKGKPVPWSTDFAGMYAHATGVDPYKLPQRWLDNKSKLRLDTPLNFVSTDDIIGGNSGSPVVNMAGDLVGLIFDGNLSSLPNRYVYGETTERAVSVDTAGMLEALNKIYDDAALTTELTAP